MNIQLPATVERRLRTLARLTKRSTNYYVRVAVLNHLDDLEDVAMAERSLSLIVKARRRSRSKKS
jgi:RHH-type transcriptional regulator, rel operon repressor / antitoxin RelB